MVGTRNAVFPSLLRLVTATPAWLLERPDLGSLASGTIGDATVLRPAEAACAFADVTDETVQQKRRLTLDSVIVGDAPWHTAQAKRPTRLGGPWPNAAR